jgi:anhydro-N-acetylmuramic acid kinase
MSNIWPACRHHPSYFHVVLLANRAKMRVEPASSVRSQMASTGRTVLAMGLMSGTSLDGVDAALLTTDGEAILEFGPTLTKPYSKRQRLTLSRAVEAALADRDDAPEIADAIEIITDTHIQAIDMLLVAAGKRRQQIDIVGMHGQTIRHRPSLNGGTDGHTWQIGDGQRVADEAQIDLVDQFRIADVAEGGQGAPLAPVFHAALVKNLGHLKRSESFEKAVAVLNIGGVANVTYVPAGSNIDGLVAFDTGPGNGLLDEWAMLKIGEPMDRDGKLARSGKVQQDVLKSMLEHPYLSRKPPKSLDRHDFTIEPVLALSAEDGAATLTAFTAACVARAEEMLPHPPVSWIVCGGGRHNPAIMDELAARLGGRVEKAESQGWNGDAVEAQLFAYLAVRSVRGLPISFPGTTGVPEPLTGGVFRPYVRRSEDKHWFNWLCSCVTSRKGGELGRLKS